MPSRPDARVSPARDLRQAFLGLRVVGIDPQCTFIPLHRIGRVPCFLVLVAHPLCRRRVRAEYL